jgi:Flp pilus assembly pilin Flp
LKTFKELFKNLIARLFNVLHNEKAQTLVEYALLLVLIAVVVMIMLKGTGEHVNCLWSRINSGINQ